MGWRGLLVDNDPNLDLSERSSFSLFADATQVNWSQLLSVFPDTIDYLSLDVNGSTLDVLKSLPLDRVAFRLITCEHDSYRLGPVPRDEIRDILVRNGYICARSDVTHDGFQFEDWWMNISERIRRTVANPSPINKYFDKVFCINLDRRTDRWEQVREQFIANDLFLERFRGIDMPDGNAGCTASHRELIRKIAESDYNRVLVLEDDFQVITSTVLKNAGFIPETDVWKIYHSIPGDDLNSRFAYLARFLPDKWDVIYLGAGYAEPPISRLNENIIRCAGMKTTSSYGITREFAKRWTMTVDAMAPVCAHPGAIDDLFSSMSRDNLFYVFQPRLMFQGAFTSDLTKRKDCYLMSMTDPVHEMMV